MSTHPHPEHDLDRTDELPRLDVEAYEAQLAAERNDTLASTDTWAVQGLREAEDLQDHGTAAVRFPRPRPAQPELPKTSDVTLDATRILGRIQQLESELANATAREGELQARVQLLTTELAAREKETRALSADNARLAEQRSIGVERVRSLEQRLHEDSARFERDLAQQRESHAAETEAATSTRLALEQQVAELRSVAVQLREANARLDDETQAAAKLASTHIELIEQLRQRIANEEKSSAQLARHLAAKIAEHASAGQELARRDATIQALTSERDELTALLDEARREHETFAVQAQRHAAARAALTTQEHELHEAHEELAALQGRIAELEARERERAEAELASAADLAAARRQIGQQVATVQSLEQVIRARDTLIERLRAELQTAQDERAIIAGQLEKSRARNKSMAREIFARDNEIASLKADLAVHAETLAAIRQDVNRATTAAEGEHPDRILEPVDHDGDVIVLDKKMMTIGRTSDNDICIASKLVSRNHARLLIGPNAVIVEDAGSTNGCLVNDVLVKQQLMREGDVLAIGDLKYRLRTRREDATRTRDNVIPFG